MEEKVTQLENETNALVANATELVIFSSEDNLLANEFLKKIMAGKKAITEYWRVPIDNANKVHKSLTVKLNEMIKPLVIGELRVKAKIGKYLTKEREERERQEREIREEVEKKEAIRLAEIAKKEKELKEAEDYLLPEQIAEEQKKIEEANKKEFTPTIIVEAEAKPSGQVVKEYFSAEVVDFAKLPDQYKLANMPMLNGLARVSKESLSIPGVKVNKRIGVETRQ